MVCGTLRQWDESFPSPLLRLSGSDRNPRAPKRSLSTEWQISAPHGTLGKVDRVKLVAGMEPRSRLRPRMGALLMNIGICRHLRLVTLSLGIASLLTPSGSVLGTTIRVVTYNIECSGLGIVAPNSGFETVIQAIGNHHLAGLAQPVDVLALQELDGVQPAPQGNSATLPYVISSLNAVYGAGAYAFDPTNDPTDGDSVGNGPNGLVYKTATIQVINVRLVGSPPSGSGAARQPIRYQLR